MTDTTIAQTILSQLGGRRFAVMTGAKNMLAGDDYLAMSLPRNKSTANKMVVRLNGLDLYDVEFVSIRGASYKVKARIENVYCDTLAQVFEHHTGMYTSL